ncbi:MAG: hypothetical protein GWN29_03970 [Gammaproteobacteria bacterium]|nr:hypothetical protein [Gammaproteobacteria bacterium]
MKAAIAISLIGLGSLAAAGAMAHHSFASEYTADKPLAMQGVVTLVEWTNPHARIYIDVVNDDNTVTNWNLELASPSALSRNGWTSRSLQVGDAVSITGFGARADNTNRVNVKSITLPDGRSLFNGRAPDAPE